jgi:hypothetical protein
VVRRAALRQKAVSYCWTAAAATPGRADVAMANRLAEVTAAARDFGRGGKPSDGIGELGPASDVPVAALGRDKV